MLKLVFLVIAMGIVTYVPRMLPITILQNIQLPPFLHRFLRFIPYAALGALIFPGILESTGDAVSAGFGGIVAVIFALFRANLMVVVVSGIIGAFLWQTLF